MVVIHIQKNNLTEPEKKILCWDNSCFKGTLNCGSSLNWKQLNVTVMNMTKCVSMDTFGEKVAIKIDSFCSCKNITLHESFRTWDVSDVRLTCQLRALNCSFYFQATLMVNQTIFGILKTSATFNRTTCDVYKYMFKLNRILKCPSFA